MKTRKANINGCWDWYIFDTCPSSKYPETYADLPDDMHDWGQYQWITYFERNKQLGSTSYAVYMFYVDYDNQGLTSNIKTIGNTWCNLLQLLASNGADVYNMFSDLYCSVQPAVVKTIDELAHAAGETYTNVAKVVENVTGNAKTLTGYTIPLLIVGGFTAFYFRDEIKAALKTYL